MKWFKRTWISIIRRPKKTLTLFLVVFSMITLLAGSLGIIMTCESIQKQIKIGVGTSANVVGNFMDDDESFVYLEKKEIVHEYVNAMETLSSDDRVANGEYHLQMRGQANFGVEFLTFTYYGTNIPKGYDFSEGKHTLVRNGKARYFTEEEIENGEYVAIVDEALAFIQTPYEAIPSGLNKIGNVITLSVPIYEDLDEEEGQLVHFYDYEFKVIGTFKNTDKNLGESIYIPNKALVEILEDAVDQAKQEGIDGKIYFKTDYAGFIIKELDDLENFDIDAKQLLSNIDDLFEYSSSSDTYRRNAGPVENLNTVARVIFIATVLATILILGLVIISIIIERKKEIGIYESIGEKTSNILMQITCEVLLVSTLAMAFSSVSGIFLGNALSDYMLEIQKYVQREQISGVIADLPVLYKPIENGVTSSRNEIIDEYEIEVNGEYFMTLLVVGELSVLLSCGIPIVYLTRLKVKDIML